MQALVTIWCSCDVEWWCACVCDLRWGGALEFLTSMSSKWCGGHEIGCRRSNVAEVQLSRRYSQDLRGLLDLLCSCVRYLPLTHELSLLSTLLSPLSSLGSRT